MSERIDPWTTIEQYYAPGQVVTGSIRRIAPMGVFASIDAGIEGIIPPTELPAWMNPLQNLYEGQHLPLRILEIDAERRHLKLSLRQAENASF